MKKVKIFAVILAVIAIVLYAPALMAAAEGEAEIQPLEIGAAYTCSDDGGTYTVTIVSETGYSLHAVSADETETFDYTGEYTYINGELTLLVSGNVFAVFTVEGYALTEIVQSETVDTETEELSAVDQLKEFMATNDFSDLAIKILLGAVGIVAYMLKNNSKASKLLSGKLETGSITLSDAIIKTADLEKRVDTVEKKLDYIVATEKEHNEIINAKMDAILNVQMLAYSSSGLNQDVRAGITAQITTALALNSGKQKIVSALAKATATVEQSTETVKSLASEVKNIIGG